jgi:ABC-type polysaccharide/polyol phosphate export permease
MFLDSLPAWARSFAWLLPLTHAVRICRALAGRTAGAAQLGDLVWILIVTGAAFVLAERWVRRRVLP